MKTNRSSMGNKKTKQTLKKFPIKLKKQLKTQSQPDNAAPPETTLPTSKCRTPRKSKSVETTEPTSQRRSSPRFKEPAEPTDPKSTTQTQNPLQSETTIPSTADTNISQRRSSPRFKEIQQPSASELPPSRKKPVSKKNQVSTATNSKELAGSSKDRHKAVKRKLDISTGPCPNVQLRNPDDTFSDFEEEEEDEILQQNKDTAEEEKDNGDDTEEEEENNVEKDDGTTDIPEDEENVVVEPPKKRNFIPRGPTQMHALRLENPTAKSTVPFNVKEQPVGEPSVQLASCLGVLVRRNIPLTHKDWRLVPQQAKVNIWKIVEQRFIVPEYYRDYYFGKMGAYLKEARSRKATLVLDAYDKLQGEEREKRLAQIMPTSMTVSEWEKFVKRVNSTEFRVNRAKMQEIRSKYTTPHTLSRQGYARKEVQMQQELKTTEPIDRADLWVTGHTHTDGRDPKPAVQEAFKKIEEAKSNHGSDGGESSVTNDFLSKALGEDKGVRITGLGYGVTRKKIAANAHYKLIIKECQENCKAMNDRLVMLEEKSSKCVCHEVSHPNRASPVASNNQASTSRVPCTQNASTAHTTSPCTLNGSTTHTTPVSSRPNEELVPEKFTACKLLSWYKDGEVVADAEICETDPAQLIHGMPIGFGAYSVCVLTSHVVNALVYRPTSEFKYVDDAVGSIISWPKDRIVY